MGIMERPGAGKSPGRFSSHSSLACNPSKPPCDTLSGDYAGIGVVVEI